MDRNFAFDYALTKITQLTTVDKHNRIINYLVIVKRSPVVDYTFARLYLHILWSHDFESDRNFARSK